MNPMVKCPQCGKKSPWSTDNKWRPFCCQRCKLIDFGDWANETNTIAGESTDNNFDHQGSDSNLNYNQFPINKNDDQ